MVLSDEDIVRLYQDPKFFGSFSGASNLRKFLFTDFGEVRADLAIHTQLCIVLYCTLAKCIFYSTCHFQDFIGYLKLFQTTSTTSDLFETTKGGATKWMAIYLTWKWTWHLCIHLG